MKPYKIIKTKQNRKALKIVNKLREPKIPLRFFKEGRPLIKKYAIEI